MNCFNVNDMSSQFYSSSYQTLIIQEVSDLIIHLMTMQQDLVQETIVVEFDKQTYRTMDSTGISPCRFFTMNLKTIIMTFNRNRLSGFNLSQGSIFGNVNQFYIIGIITPVLHQRNSQISPTEN